MITDCGNTTQDEHWADDASKMQIWFSTEKSLLSALSRDLEGGRRAGQSLAQSLQGSSGQPHSNHDSDDEDNEGGQQGGGVEGAP